MSSFRRKVVGKKYKCIWCTTLYEAQNESQYFCDTECAWRYWQDLPTRAKGKRIAREIASGFGFRSLAELGFHAQMERQGFADQTEYEPESFKWTPKIRTYTPDWRVTRKDGSVFYIEFKGKLDQDTRSKLLGIKKSLPDLDLRLVFEKHKNKISSRSSTRYYQWAESNGFPWSSLERGIPEEWMEVK